MARAGGRMFAISTNKAGFLKAMNRFEASIDLSYKKMLVKFAVQMNDRLLARTPVWEGTTIRNWQWALRSPANTVKIAEGGSTPPGPTNSMALGTEPRRGANESAQKAGLMIFLADLMMSPTVPTIYLTNPAPNAAAVEYGMLPTAERARTPAGGILRIALAETLTAMGAR